MKRLQTTISDEAMNKLEQIRIKRGYSNINMAIEWALANYEIGSKMDVLITAIEGMIEHRVSIPEDNNSTTSINNIPGVFKASALKERKIVSDESI